MQKLLSSVWFLALVALVAAAVPTTIVLMGAVKNPPVVEEYVEPEVDGAAVAALWAVHSGEVEALAEDLKQEKASLAEEKAAVRKREDRLKAELIELRRIQSRLAEDRAALDATIVQLEANSVKFLKDQADLYTNMEPADVVKIFDELGDIKTANILYFMDEEVKAEIFAAMIEAAPAPRIGVNGEALEISGAQRVARLNELLKFTQVEASN